MIRLTHVITGLDRGGAEGMLVRILLRLNEGNFEQRVVSLTDRGAYGETIDSARVPLVVLGMTGIETIPRTLMRLRREINEFRPDIVQTWLYHADLFGLAAARLAGYGAVAWSIRCAALAPDETSISTHFLIGLLARLSAKPDAVLFNSVAGQRSHRLMGYRPRRELIIPNGFDLQVWRPDAQVRVQFRAELGVPDGIFVIGIIARYHAVKDHRCFISAAAHICSLRADVRFVLAGHGIDWSNQRLTADIDEFKIRDHVILVGPRSDIPYLMTGLDCLVMSSTSEGFPNVIGEAMASGVPCVATDVGEAGTIISDTGCVVKVGDAKSIADGVLAIMASTPEERTALKSRCRARIAENFSIERAVARYTELYEELYEKRKQETSGERR